MIETACVWTLVGVGVVSLLLGNSALAAADFALACFLTLKSEGR